MARATTMRKLGADDLSAAVGVVARGMRDNPLNIAAFGEDASARVERLKQMFTIALPMSLRKGVLLGAFDGKTLVGVAAMVPPGRCQPSASEKIGLLPRMVWAIGLAGVDRVVRWQGAWSEQDLHEAHWHLGPVAVDMHLQGHGIGRALMNEFCARIDRAGEAAIWRPTTGRTWTSTSGSDSKSSARRPSSARRIGSCDACGRSAATCPAARPSSSPSQGRQARGARQESRCSGGE